MIRDDDTREDLVAEIDRLRTDRDTAAWLLAEAKHQHAELLGQRDAWWDHIGREQSALKARIDAALAKLKAADNLIVDWQPSLEDWAKCVSLIINARGDLLSAPPV